MQTPPAGLAALLKFGRTETMAGDANAWLCRAFGVEPQQDIPLAPYALLGDGGTPGSDYWLRADPVVVQLMRNRLILLTGSVAAPSAEEAEQFITTLNQHFAPEGLHFSAPHPQRWYLRLPAAPGLHTHALAEVHGRDIRHFLPEGPDSAHWRKLLNEAQVLLHTHPLNAARETAGQLPINSIWPWGGGILSQNLSAPCDKLYADEPLARGLAGAAGISHAPLPASFPETPEGAGDAPLFVMENLSDTMGARDSALERFDRAWLTPAIAAVQRGAVQRLTLIAAGENSTVAVTLTRADLWKFWRRGTTTIKQLTEMTGDK
jgi:hypothetical protein